MFSTIFAFVAFATFATAHPPHPTHPTHPPPPPPHHHSTPFPFNDTMEICWRDGYCRGDGSFPKECPEGYVLDHGHCFEECKANYTGYGPICWQNCPEGFYDHGSICQIPPHSYNPCPRYDPCGHKTPGCRGNCSEGYQPRGCSCFNPGQIIHKDNYHRNISKGPYCPANETESFGLCFEPCKSGYVGVGPVCWRNDSGNATYPVECNPFAFGHNETDCHELNWLLWKAGFTTPFCIGPLAISIITGHAVGPHYCRDLIKNVLPALEKSPQC